MFGDITQANQIYIACGYTDMRKSIDGLVLNNPELITPPVRSLETDIPV